MFKPSLHCSREQRRRPGWQMNGQEGGVWGGREENEWMSVFLWHLYWKILTLLENFQPGKSSAACKVSRSISKSENVVQIFTPPTPLVWALESFLRHNKKFRQDLSPVWELIIVGTLLSYTRPKTSGTVWGEILKRRCDSYWNGRAAKGWNCHPAFFNTN